MLKLFCVVILLCLIATPSQAKKPSTPASDEQKVKLPDVLNPAIKRELTCSACRATARDIFVDARTMADKRRGRISELDWVEVFDGFCVKMVKANGLLMRNNLPTTTYSDVSAINRISGSWVNTFLEDRCVELMDDYEEKIKTVYLSLSSADEMQALLCESWAKKCTAEESQKHEALIRPVAEEEKTDKEAAVFYEREKKKARAKQAAEKEKEKETMKSKSPQNMVPKMGDL